MLGQFDEWGAVPEIDFELPAIDLPDFDFGGTWELPMDEWTVNGDWGEPIPWEDTFSGDPWGDPGIGLDPWDDTLQVGTGNIGLDVPSESTVPEFELPDLTAADFLKYGAAALTLWGQYESIQAARDRGFAPLPVPYGTTAPRPTTRVVVDPVTGQRRTQVLDPRTGQYVDQSRIDPATGQPLTFNPATGQYAAGAPSIIPGVPNWALIGGGVGLVALLFMGRR